MASRSSRSPTRGPRVGRRAFACRALALGCSALGGFALGATPSCKPSARGLEARCEMCGMKIDEASAFRCELLVDGAAPRPFDTPRCALTVLARVAPGAPRPRLRVQEFYDRTWLFADEAVRFAVGSDVVGPMGPDLVPVAEARAEKFARDHAAERTLKLDEVTPAVLDGIK